MRKDDRRWWLLTCRSLRLGHIAGRRGFGGFVVIHYPYLERPSPRHWRIAALSTPVAMPDIVPHVGEPERKLLLGT
jgi:hypothetical protein